LQIFGLNGAFLTGDVFNLFVFFEVLLLASYGLMLHGGGRLRTKAGLHYLVINLVGSTLFLIAVGALYGVVGTLNLADMAMKIGQLSPADQPVVLVAGLLLLVVFAIKAAAFPVYLWLPQTYATTSAPVAALFAIMTKVGLYAILRVHGQIFGEQAGDLAGVHWPYVFWAGLVTLGLASLGVMAARGLREQAAYLVLASVALLMAGMALNQPQTLAATLYYWVHSTLLAAGFFLLADLIARGRGAWEDRFEVGPVMPRAVLLGGLFFAYGVALTGLPPLSGFIGKAWMIQAALTQPQGLTLMLVVLVTSLLMVVAMARSGSLLFYKAQVAPSGQPMATCRICEQGGLAFVALIFSLLWVVFAGPASGLMESISQQVFDWQTYQSAVLGQKALGGVQ
jgi:multicomponent K+:H+ antiporter subunit D